ncbi:50S ribosomal protein L30 [archaeon]|jgi:large subunit ribosomal protein L30|nr:50S ribosomal protein L30 [archaeon]TET26950.1 MAG: 50S ribosomal protein L30 [Candidatus Bathyarchaeum sp.]
MAEQRKCLVAVRIRGLSDISQETKDTLMMLRLTRNCHATLLDDRPAYNGMLRKSQHCLTWGEVSQESIALLLKKRGRLVGDKKLTDEYAKELDYKSLDDLAEAIFKVDIEFSSLPEVKPVFRLRPPKKGYKGKVKKSYAAGGEAGYRGDAINDLLKRMV